MSDEVWWFIALVTVFVLPLLVGAAFVEQIAPRARKSLRRLERIRRGRAAQARQHAEAQARLDEQRREAARWIAGNCYWRQK